MVLESSAPLQGISPPAAVPNFPDLTPQCWHLDITAALCLSLALGSVLLRTYSKVYVIKKPTIDDCKSGWCLYQ